MCIWLTGLHLPIMQASISRKKELTCSVRMEEAFKFCFINCNSFLLSLTECCSFEIESHASYKFFWCKKKISINNPLKHQIFLQTITKIDHLESYLLSSNNQEVGHNKAMIEWWQSDVMSESWLEGMRIGPSLARAVTISILGWSSSKGKKFEPICDTARWEESELA